MELALGDLKVLDLTHFVAGPACTKLLADFGADVLKVERLEGDPARNLGPFFRDRPHPDQSGVFLHLNTNKRSITLNLKSRAGAQLVEELARDADVLVESFRPGVMEGLGLGYDTLRSINPALVMVSVSNFGQSGPYRDLQGTDLVLYSMGGPMQSNSKVGEYPVRLPGMVTQMHAGYVAAVATLMGFFGSRYKGIGQHIDCSIFESQAMSVDRRLTGLLTHQYHGEIVPRSDVRGAGYPQGVYPCKDGYVNVWGGLQFFPLTARMMEMPEMADDPHWATRDAQLDSQRKDEFDVIFLPWIIERTKLEYLQMARRAGLLSGALFTVEDLLQDPHYQARDFFPEVDHPATGPVRYVGPIVKMPASPAGFRAPAPLLGQHNEEVYHGQLGFTKADLVRMRRMGVI